MGLAHWVGWSTYGDDNISTICLTQLRERCALAAKIAKEENATKIIPTGGDPQKVLDKENVIILSMSFLVSFPLLIQTFLVFSLAINLIRTKVGITEAEAMGKILQELEVEEEKLILEKEAVDTTTNARNVLKLVQDEVLVKQVVLEEAKIIF